MGAKKLSTKQLVQNVLSQTEHWQQDLTQIPDLVDDVTEKGGCYSRKRNA